jgi:hypothetical protein
MQPIPRPEVLDPGRVNADEREDMSLDDHRNRASLLAEALQQTSEYATTLWDHLDAVRAYLYDSLPSDPRRPGPDPRASAAPTGPDDQRGWEDWIATYSAVTSVLAGPHGDSGFGLSEAEQAARIRRDAPNLRLLAEHPTTRALAGQDNAEPSRSGPFGPPPVSSHTGRTLRAIALGALSALAIRGVVLEGRQLRVRPRRRR